MRIPDTLTPKEPAFADTLLALLYRQKLTEAQGAALLGVPVYTLRKWLTGQRVPSAAAVRLVDVLMTLEALSPDMLAALTPTLAPESEHVEKSAL